MIVEVVSKKQPSWQLQLGAAKWVISVGDRVPEREKTISFAV